MQKKSLTLFHHRFRYPQYRLYPSAKLKMMKKKNRVITFRRRNGETSDTDNQG